MRNFLICCFLLASSFLSAQQYDLVLEGGRVMDPETGLDAVRNVGIRDGKIAKISTSPSTGAASFTPPDWSSRRASSTCISMRRISPASVSRRSTA